MWRWTAPMLSLIHIFPQAEIAKQLSIPVGTVKSRLHTAKQNFKTKYPYNTEVSKGESTMKKLPEFIPEYKIETSAKAPFSVKWEELMGWFLIPKLGERLSWGMYDLSLIHISIMISACIILMWQWKTSIWAIA